MQVKSIKVGNLETNCYVLSENGNAIVIDPGDEFIKIKPLLEKNRLIAIPWRRALKKYVKYRVGYAINKLSIVQLLYLLINLLRHTILINPMHITNIEKSICANRKI